jgi:hypothetical protein
MGDLFNARHLLFQKTLKMFLKIFLLHNFKSLFLFFKMKTCILNFILRSRICFGVFQSKQIKFRTSCLLKIIGIKNVFERSSDHSTEIPALLHSVQEKIHNYSSKI